jgi:predicted AlkP superfamily pyrophosphatase or phosphodiesterase
LAVVLVAISAHAAERITDCRPTVILVSLDGFRPDYLDKVDTPNLHEVIDRGAHAKYMIPSFPTKTFPNHYTIVTGLYPAHHGIVANDMYDPILKEKFSKKNPESMRDPRWWGGEPIWIAAEKQGIRTAPLMWPGALVDHDGVRPEYREEYAKDETPAQRVDKLLALLDRPVTERPQFLTLYLDSVDDVGHDFGPDSSQVRDAVTEIDRAIGQLRSALHERGIDEQVNLLIVSDHGMASVPRRKVVIIDGYLDPKSVDVVDSSPVLSLIPKDGDVQGLYKKAQRIPHAKAYLASQMPERWHLGDSPRITPVVVVVNDEWTVTSREYLETHERLDLGNHGFDNTEKDMRAIFLAEGPAFEHGTLKPFSNVNVYSLLAFLLNIVPAKTDGSLEVFRPVMNQRTQTNPTRKERAPWQKEWDEVAFLALR